MTVTPHPAPRRLPCPCPRILLFRSPSPARRPALPSSSPALVSGAGPDGSMRGLVSPQYARLWSSVSASAAADSMIAMAAALWVAAGIGAGREWAPEAAGGILAASRAAAALAAPAAGILTDRAGPRALLLGTELARCGTACGLAALTFLPARALPPPAWVLLLCAAAAGTSAAGCCAKTARWTLIAGLIPANAGRARAAGLAHAAEAAAGILGPAAAAPLMIAGGPRLAAAAAAAAYAASWLCCRPLPASPPGPREGSLAAGIAGGLKAFRRSPVLPPMLAVMMTCQAGTASLAALNVLFVTGRAGTGLGGGAGTFAAAEAVTAAGLVLGACTASRLARAAGDRNAICLGLAAAGLLAGAYASQRTVPAGLACLLGYAWAIGILDPVSDPLIMAAAPDGFQGRIRAVLGPCNQATAAVSAAAAGWAAAGILHGTRDAAPVALTMHGSAMLITGAAILAITILPARLRVPRPGEQPGHPADPGPESPARPGGPA